MTYRKVKLYTGNRKWESNTVFLSHDLLDQLVIGIFWLNATLKGVFSNNASYLLSIVVYYAT